MKFFQNILNSKSHLSGAFSTLNTTHFNTQNKNEHHYNKLIPG